MDDRTTIAMNMLVAMQTVLMEKGKSLSVRERNEAMVAIVQATDEFLAELSRTAKDKTPQCPPPAAPKGLPVWRPGTYLPPTKGNSNVSNNVLAVKVEKDTDPAAFVVYHDRFTQSWRYFSDSQVFDFSDCYRWTDIPRPEVSE